MENQSLTSEKSVKDRAGEAGMIGAIARWCECLHAQAPIHDALKQIMDGIGAESIALSRASRTLGGGSKIISVDKSTEKSTLVKLDRSFARSVLGAYFEKPKSGSIWFKSMVEDDPDPVLRDFHRRRNLTELVIVPLSTNEKTIDFLEIHFAANLLPTHHAMLNMVAGTLAQTWKNRTPGLFTDSILRAQKNRVPDQTSGPILGMENPARLSRAEYRVCLLLSRGKTIDSVQEELAICKSTVRTHLSSIYAKTHTSNQSELMYHLLAFTPVSEHSTTAQIVA